MLPCEKASAHGAAELNTGFKTGGAGDFPRAPVFFFLFFCDFSLINLNKFCVRQSIVLKVDKNL